MISTLILNVLVACQAGKSTSEQVMVRPPDAPEAPDTTPNIEEKQPPTPQTVDVH